MKVLKFGGTSVGSVSSILSLQKIVEKEAKHQPIIVVVSALGGITDQLIATSQLALKGDESWKTEFDSIVARHHKMIDAIITDPHDREILFSKVDSLFEQLQSIYYGVFLIHDLSHKTEDTIGAMVNALVQESLQLLSVELSGLMHVSLLRLRRNTAKEVLIQN